MGEEDLEKGEVENERNLDRGGYNKETPPEDDVCPICFGRFELPCQTSCGHWFFSKCFLQLWRHNSDSKPCNCPMCNNIVKKLVPLSPKVLQLDIRKTLKQVVKQYFQSDERQILKDVEQYNLLHDDTISQKMTHELGQNGCPGIPMLLYLVSVVVYVLFTLIMVICSFTGSRFLPDSVVFILMISFPIGLSIWSIVLSC